MHDNSKAPSSELIIFSVAVTTKADQPSSDLPGNNLGPPTARGPIQELSQNEGLRSSKFPSPFERNEWTFRESKS